MRKSVTCNSYSDVQQLKTDIDELKCSLSISINETKLLRLQIQEMCNVVRESLNKPNVSNEPSNEVSNQK
jgi:regulator of replication initiation timing